MLKDLKRRPVASLTALILVIIGILLGSWQLERAHGKENLATELKLKEELTPLNANEKNWTLDQALHHRVIAKGVFIVNEGIWLENRPPPLGRDPKTGITTGFFLLMPLMLEGTKKVLWVNRGWKPRSFLNINEVPNVVTPSGLVTVTGVVFPDAGKTLQVGDDSVFIGTNGMKIKENLNLLEEQKGHQWDQFPFILRQDKSMIDDELDRQMPPYNNGSEKHYAYAFQWFGLSLMTFIFWLVTGLRKRSKSLR